MSDNLLPCPFCGKQFVLKGLSGGQVSFEHDSPGCPLEEQGLQVIALSVEKMTEMLNNRPRESTLLSLASEQQYMLNRLLQLGMRWVELYAAYKAADKEDRFREWWEANGDSLELARQRLFEALKEVAVR